MKKVKIINALKTVFDPELGIDIYTMGLIYDIKITGKQVDITMTLSSPMCPYGPQLMQEVEQKIKELGMKVKVTLTFEPMWEPNEELKLKLGLM